MQEKNEKILTAVPIFALLVIVIAGCSPAGLHGDNGGQANEGTANHQDDVTGYEPRKNEFSESMVINAPVEDVFPLLGPIREYDWIPGWEADMIWSE